MTAILPCERAILEVALSEKEQAKEEKKTLKKMRAVDRFFWEAAKQSATSPLPPLADPVVAATFPDVARAGLAAESLFGAIVAEDGMKIDKSAKSL
jgi:16S rRNA U1498 N3-methylase RsmE